MSLNEFVSYARLAARDQSGTDKTILAVIALLVVIFVGLAATLGLLLFRRNKKRKAALAEQLPQYNAKNVSSASFQSTGGATSNPLGLTIQTTSANGRQSVVIFSRDGSPMLANPESPPYSPDNVPEIRITFPDEQDEQGHCKSGRVVVVHVGEHNAVGMEPVPADEQLPAYEKDSKTAFYSIDMDKIGGLKEKEFSS